MPEARSQAIASANGEAQLQKFSDLLSALDLQLPADTSDAPLTEMDDEAPALTDSPDSRLPGPLNWMAATVRPELTAIVTAPVSSEVPRTTRESQPVRAETSTEMPVIMPLQTQAPGREDLISARLPEQLVVEPPVSESAAAAFRVNAGSEPVALDGSERSEKKATETVVAGAPHQVDEQPVPLTHTVPAPAELPAMPAQKQVSDLILNPSRTFARAAGSSPASDRVEYPRVSGKEPTIEVFTGRIQQNMTPSDEPLQAAAPHNAEIASRTPITRIPPVDAGEVGAAFSGPEEASEEGWTSIEAPAQVESVSGAVQVTTETRERGSVSRPAEVLPANPVRPVPEPQQTAATPLRRLTVSVPGENDTRTDIHFTQRNGALNLDVRTSQPGVAQDLQRDLPDLMRTLDTKGYRSEMRIGGDAARGDVAVADTASQPVQPDMSSENRSDRGDEDRRRWQALYEDQEGSGRRRQRQGRERYEDELYSS